MISRFLFVGYTDDIHSVTCNDCEECYVALSYKDDMVFLYVESNEQTVNPHLLAGGTLKSYPDGKKWERAVEIYHYSKPVSAEQWNRKIREKTPFVTFNRLKPEMTASYIFYHYQLQEEYPGGSDRYGVIYLFLDMLIFYHEMPKEPETDVIEGSLNTEHSPREHWDTIMEKHFDGSWEEIENLEFTTHIGFEREEKAKND